MARTGAALVSSTSVGCASITSFERTGDERTLPFRSQMAKVQLMEYLYTTPKTHKWSELAFSAVLGNGASELRLERTTLS